MCKFGSFMHPCQGQGWGIFSVLFHKHFPCSRGFVSFWELTVDLKPIPFCVGWGGSLLWSPLYHCLCCSPWVMIKSTRKVTDWTLGDTISMHLLENNAGYNIIWVHPFIFYFVIPCSKWLHDGGRPNSCSIKLR